MRIPKALLIALVIFPIGAACGIAADRLNLFTNLMNGLRANEPAARPLPGEETSLPQELLEFVESQYVARRDAYQAALRFDSSASQAQLETIGNTARMDYLRLLQPKAHEAAIRNLRAVPLDPGPNYRLEHISFSDANGLTVRGVLSTPTAGKGPYPVVIIPTGTGATGYDVFSIPQEEYHHGAGRKFSGDYIVLGLDMPSMNDDVFHMSNAAGQNENFYLACDKVSSALDFVLDNPAADKSKVGIYGISLGGYAAIVGAACDDRITTIAASGTNVFTSKATDIRRLRRFEVAFQYSYNSSQLPDLYQVLYGMFPKPVIMEMSAADTSGEYAEALQNSQKVLDYYRLRNKAGNASRILIEDDTCRGAWRNHCMEVTRVKQAFDSLFLGKPATAP